MIALEEEKMDTFWICSYKKYTSESISVEESTGWNCLCLDGERDLGSLMFAWHGSEECCIPGLRNFKFLQLLGLNMNLLLFSMEDKIK